MKGAWLENRQLVFRADLLRPIPANGESLVRVLLAGICNTDIELTRGYYSYAGVPGHEFVGLAESGPLAGKRVVGEINASCGSCDSCAHGRRTHCERRSVLGIKERNGAFAEYLTLPVENLHVVPDGVPDEVAVFTEPLAAALEIQEQVRIGPDDRVLVVGNGKLGRLIAASLALTGCKLMVAGREHGEIAARSFDVVVLSQTLQATHRPLVVLAEMMRVGRVGIVSFPNFGFLRHRIMLGVGGRMPVSPIIPYPWHDTPNIHFCTLLDFEALVREVGVRCTRRLLLDQHGRLAPAWVRLRPNLLAAGAVYVLGR